MKFILFFIYFLFQNTILGEVLKEEDFFNVFKRYYFPEKVYYDIEEEKELAKIIFEELSSNEIEIRFENSFSYKKKAGINFPKNSTFYSRVCYLTHLVIEDGLITKGSGYGKKYNIIPDKSWNYFKRTSGLPQPYYLNCYFNIREDFETFKFKNKSMIKAKERKNFCNEDFCYGVFFNFYLIAEGFKEGNLKDKIPTYVFKIISIIEKAPFSNKRIWEIYGNVLEVK